MEKTGFTGGVSGLTLKMIAIATMLIDHIAAVVIKNMYSFVDEDGVYVFTNAIAYDAYSLMRLIGRMAFPLFCFMLVQGFYHTKSKGKYSLKLVVFAVISEIPYDLALNGKLFSFTENNVMWTLLLGLLTIWLLDEIRNNPRFLNKSKDERLWLIATLLRCIGMTTIVMISMLAAEYLICCDYGAGGIAAIVAIYLLYRHPLIGFAVAVTLLGLLCSEDEFAALAMLVPLYFYNGKRGKQIKCFFYWFYPVHLLCLYFVSIFLIGK